MSFETDSVWQNIVKTRSSWVPRPLSCRTESSRQRQCPVTSRHHESKKSWRQLSRA